MRAKIQNGTLFRHTKGRFPLGVARAIVGARASRKTVSITYLTVPMLFQVRLQLGATGGPFGVASGIIAKEGFGALYTVSGNAHSLPSPGNNPSHERGPAISRLSTLGSGVMKCSLISRSSRIRNSLQTLRASGVVWHRRFAGVLIGHSILSWPLTETCVGSSISSCFAGYLRWSPASGHVHHRPSWHPPEDR